MKTNFIKTLVLDWVATPDCRNIPYYRYLPKQVKLGHIGPKSTWRMRRWGVHEYLRQYILTYYYCPMCDVVLSGSFLHGFGLSVFQMLGLRKKPKHIIVDLALRKIRWNTCARAFLAFMRSASKIICFTTAQTNWWNKQLGLLKATFVPLGVDDEKISPANNEKNYIFSAGRISRDYATLVKAARNIRMRTIIVAGRDPLTRKTNLEGLTLPCNVEVHYELPYDQYIQLLRESKLVVLPLRDVPYACGQRVLLEAFAAGKPLIVTKTTSTVDYVENNRTGVFVRPNNQEELQLAISSLLQNENLRKYLGYNARRMVEMKFNFREMGKNMFKIIDEVFYGR